MNTDRDPTVMMIEGMMARMSEERKAAAENMRLGQFIEALEKCDPALPVVLDRGGSLDSFMSYRGYYEDLAVAPTHEVNTVKNVLDRARAAVGEMFEGYKGGEYWMTKNTLLWVAGWGSCGDKLVGVNADGDKVIVVTAEDAL